MVMVTCSRIACKEFLCPIQAVSSTSSQHLISPLSLPSDVIPACIGKLLQTLIRLYFRLRLHGVRGLSSWLPVRAPPAACLISRSDFYCPTYPARRSFSDVIVVTVHHLSALAFYRQMSFICPAIDSGCNVCRPAPRFAGT